MSVADVRPLRAVRRAAPIVTISAISVARPITAMDSTSKTAAHAGSTKVAAYAGTAEAAAHVSAAAEPAAYMSATPEAATPASRLRWHLPDQAPLRGCRRDSQSAACGSSIRDRARGGP